jgi:UPF0755 protein
MRNLALLIKTLLILAFLAILSGTFLTWQWLTVPPPQPPRMAIEVKEGETLRDVIVKLTEAKAIRWPLMFRLYARLHEAGSSIRAGDYEFEAPIGPHEILVRLARGVVTLAEFSHPPGWNMWQVAERLNGVFPHIPTEQWRAAFADPLFLKMLPEGARSLEGFLFPDVYRIRKKPSVNEVVQMFLKNFNKNFTPEIIASGKRLGLSPLQIVTLASIIEKETGVAKERALISAVFHTRLQKGMRLQTDPTVIYGIWNRFDGNLRRRDLETYTPYNTYAISGLPPGPIANPGLEALMAAVHPAPSPYVYFVAKGDGTHHFSTTLEEHNAAVRQFQVLPSQKSQNKL